jgi:hypothetical protein
MAHGRLGPTQDSRPQLRWHLSLTQHSSKPWLVIIAPIRMLSGCSAGPVAWDLKGSLGSGSNVTYQGQPDANTTSSYFMLMKTGPDFTAIPVSGITFRPNDR